MDDLHFDTLSLHAGYDPFDFGTRDIAPAISPTATYVQDAPGSFNGFDYSRHGNPTRAVLEKGLAELENAKYGLVFSSGCATALNILHLLGAGDHIISVNDLYGGIGRIFLKLGSNMGITTTFVDNANAEGFAEAIQKNTKLVWLESPSNPLLKVCDIEKISKLVKKINPKIVVAVDNTFLTPHFQRPLDLGADISMYSLTKYINGHHDVIMGAVVLNDKNVYDQLYFLQKTIGATPSPFDCYQVFRGIKTLPLRMERHQKNGLELARFLEKHPKIEKVFHPLLESHPQLELTKKQTTGHSGMLSFYVEGPIANTIKFLKALKIVHMATSLGGCSTTLAVPTLMIPVLHEYASEDSVGVTKSIDDKLIRLSAGLENIDDLVNDFDQALKKAFE